MVSYEFRMVMFRTRFGQLVGNKFGGDDPIPIQDLIPMINDGLPNDALFGTSEALKCMEPMVDSNEIMISENVVYIM